MVESNFDSQPKIRSGDEWSTRAAWNDSLSLPPKCMIRALPLQQSPPHHLHQFWRRPQKGSNWENANAIHNNLGKLYAQNLTNWVWRVHFYQLLLPGTLFLRHTTLAEGPTKHQAQCQKQIYASVFLSVTSTNLRSRTIITITNQLIP